MTNDELLEAIMGIIETYGGDDLGLSEKEISSQLPDVDKDEILEALIVLWENNHIQRFVIGSKELFNVPTQVVEKLQVRDQIEREMVQDRVLWSEDEQKRTERSRNLFTKGVFFDIAEAHTEEEQYALMVRDIATTIANEDPIELIISVAKWVVDDLNDLVTMLKDVIRHNPKEVSRISRELNFRAKKAEKLLQRLFRLDTPDFMTIPTIEKLRKGKVVTFRESAAREHLKTRIFGETFLTIHDVPENKHHSAIGTDASVGDIFIPHQRGSFISPTPASLFVAGAAMRVRDNVQDFRNYYDYDIDTREIEVFGDVQAAEEGWFITPRLKDEVISDFEHMRVAAMDLRQYSQEMRIINQQCKWHPFGEVPELKIPPQTTLIFRDGRIFPLVHRIEDYEGASAPDEILYGTIVRKEINMFCNVFHNTSGRGRHGITYVGAVKAPAFSWLSMLVFWYLYQETGDTKLEKAFYHPPLNDQAVFHLLSWGVCKDNPHLTNINQRKTITTFQIIRRFSDIAFTGHPVTIYDDDGTRAINEDSEDDWYEFIQNHIRDVDIRHALHRRATPSLGDKEEYRSFIDLCYRSCVALFYGAPTRLYDATLNHRAHMLMPRWEVSLDLNQRNFDEILNAKVQDLLMWITDVDGLAEDGKHAVGGFNEVSSSLPLFIPDVISQAHDAVTYTRDIHSSDVSDKILELINLIRRQRR